MRQEYENMIRRQPKIKRNHNCFKIAEYEAAFVLHRQLLTEAKKLLDTERKIKSWHNAAIDLLFVRAFDTFNSILLLCEKGYGTDAYILVRSLFINFLYCKHIMTGDKDALGLRFIRHSFVIRKKLNGILTYEDIERRFYECEHVNFLEDYFAVSPGSNKKIIINLNEWTGKTIRELSVFLGEEEHYTTVFYMSSAATHVNSFSVNLALNPEADNYETEVGPSDRDVKKALFISQGYFIHILNFWANSFNVKLDAEIYFDKLAARQKIK
jgi:hypothetical protein